MNGGALCVMISGEQEMSGWPVDSLGTICHWRVSYFVVARMIAIRIVLDDVMHLQMAEEPVPHTYSV